MRLDVFWILDVSVLPFHAVVRHKLQCSQTPPDASLLVLISSMSLNGMLVSIQHDDQLGRHDPKRRSRRVGDAAGALET